MIPLHIYTSGLDFFLEGELDYVRILNGVLPDDIRVLGWCHAPLNFSARFVVFSYLSIHDLSVFLLLLVAATF